MIKTMTVIDKLQYFLQMVAKHADHFCKPENKNQLEWIMWRWANIFYSARLTDQGYEDSISYFMDSFEWAGQLTTVQRNRIEVAAAAHTKLAQFGYINKEFTRENYVCDTEKIKQLEESTPNEITLLCVKKNKTFDDHVKYMQLVYPSLAENNGTDMILTYYGGYQFENGYLEKNDNLVHDPMFVYGWKDVPAEIMSDFKMLNSITITECQNDARKEWESRLIERYKSMFEDNPNITKELKWQMKGFSVSQWVYFVNNFMETLKIDKAHENVNEPYSLVLGIDPKIFKVTKDSHHSYVAATIEICNKAIASPKTKEKDLIRIKNLLSSLQ